MLGIALHSFPHLGSGRPMLCISATITEIQQVLATTTIHNDILDARYARVCGVTRLQTRTQRFLNEFFNCK